MSSPARSCARTMAVLALLMIAACSDDDNPAGPGTTPDTTPPSVSLVTAIDAGHIEVVFSEAVTRASAENTANYSIVATTIASSTREQSTAAGGGLSIVAASLGSDNRKLTLTTTPAMLATGYSINIQNIVDRAGNPMGQPVEKAFAGSTAADNTSPALVFRKPADGATNVSVTDLIELTFSEPIQQSSLEASFGLSSGQGIVAVAFSTTDDTHFYGAHEPLALNLNYEIVIHGVLDYAGNPSSHTAWTFQTTAVTP